MDIIFTKKIKGRSGSGKRGFSLFELLVSLSIFTILTTVLLIKNSTFKGDILVTNLAYEVALTVREAQTYGINVKAVNTGTQLAPILNYNYPYGVHFDYSIPTAYVLFSDQNSNGLYALSGSEEIKTYSIQQGNKISSICVTDTNNTKSCDAAIGYIDITFKRPDPDAMIKTSLNSVMKSAEITLISPKGVTKKVTVERTGQISVQE